MIAAGTGILPFIDLLDLLFKKQIFMSLKSESKDTSIVKPCQDYDSLFNGASFKLFCGFRTLEDFIGWEWIDKLAELSYQSGQNLFQCVSKLSEKVNFKGIVSTEQYFDAEFYSNQISDDTEKIWVCGPPLMQTKIYEELRSNGISADKIFFV